MIFDDPVYGTVEVSLHDASPARERGIGGRCTRTPDTRNNDILRAVNGAVSTMGVSVGLRFPGDNIPVAVDGTWVCALLFGTMGV